MSCSEHAACVFGCLRNVTALYNGWSSNGDLVLSTSFGAQDTFFVKEVLMLVHGDHSLKLCCALGKSSHHVITCLRDAQVPIEGLKEALQLMVEGPWSTQQLCFDTPISELRFVSVATKPSSASVVTSVVTSANDVQRLSHEVKRGAFGFQES